MFSNKIMVPRNFLQFLTPPAFMGGWGCFLVHLYTSHRLSLLQHPRFHFLTLGAGILLVGVSVLYPFILERSPVVLRPWKFLGMLICFLAPLTVYLLYPLNPATINSLISRGDWSGVNNSVVMIFDDTPPSWLLAAEKRKVVSPSLLDLVAVINHSKLKTRLERIKVRIFGQIKEGTTPGHFQLTRLMMFCCAADAKVLSLDVEGEPGILKPDQWAWVEGELYFQEGEEAPYLKGFSCEAASAPAEVFLY